MIIISNYINKNKEQNIIKEKAQNGENIIDTYGKSASGGIDYKSYFDVKLCMQQYLNYINMKNLKYGYYNDNKEYVSTSTDAEIRQGIYNLLSKKYITEKNITTENLYNHIKILQKSATFVPVEASLIQDGNIKRFIVYGLIESDEDYTVINKIFAVVNIDLKEARFSIELIDGDYTSISEINIEKFEEGIEANNDNKCVATQINAKLFPAEYINLYKGLALGSPEKLYNLLDEEYKNAKFASFDEFKKYIEQNRAKIARVKLDKYQIEVKDNKARYICIDQFGNYYIIKQNEILQDYTVMLDKYTINLPEFIEKYDNSEVNVKVALNIEKLIEATKLEDYKYVYSKLNESFKSSYLKNQETFEKFINMKYDPESDVITYEKYEEITGVHVYHIKVTKQKENKEINAKVVMDLKENRDFEISFSKES